MKCNYILENNNNKVINKCHARMPLSCIQKFVSNTPPGFPPAAGKSAKRLRE